jgi:hypothetical protein
LHIVKDPAITLTPKLPTDQHDQRLSTLGLRRRQGTREIAIPCTHSPSRTPASQMETWQRRTVTDACPDLASQLFQDCACREGRSTRSATPGARVCLRSTPGFESLTIEKLARNGAHTHQIKVSIFFCPETASDRLTGPSIRLRQFLSRQSLPAFDQLGRALQHRSPVRNVISGSSDREIGQSAP